MIEGSLHVYQRPPRLVRKGLGINYKPETYEAQSPDVLRHEGGWVRLGESPPSDCSCTHVLGLSRLNETYP